MKTYMPLDGFRWSCDSDSALCDIPQTNVLGQAGGGGIVSALASTMPNTLTRSKAISALTLRKSCFIVF